MMRLERMSCAGAVFVSIVAAAGGAAAATPPAPVAQRPASARAVVALGRLHHVARREIALGLLAQVAAVRPETIAFATELETDFRVLDGRIVTLAAALGIGEGRLRRAYAADNTVALGLQTDALDRLSMVRGAEFDRLFWVTVARDQLAASDLLASAAGTAPGLEALVAETVRLVDRSRTRAKTGAAATAARPPVSPRR